MERVQGIPEEVKMKMYYAGSYTPRELEVLAEYKCPIMQNWSTVNMKDPLFGLRAYKQDVLDELLSIENGYDWAVSVNKLMKKYSKESGYVSIDAIYTPHSLSNKSLTYFKGFQMLYRMILMEFARKVELSFGNSYTDLDLLQNTNVFLPNKRLKPLSRLDERLYIVSKFD